MSVTRIRWALAALSSLFAATGLLLSVACVAVPAGVSSGAAVDDARLVNADRDAGNWLTYGRTYSEQRYSPLKRINADNVKQLGLAWYADLDTNRGQEATPLVIDGVMYVSTAWSLVKAYDARSGKLLWSYDPAVPKELGVNGCCDVVSRGVAAWKGKIFVATFDGRLVALDAATGQPVWTTVTVDTSKPYTITQAPRVIKGRVIIGVSGGEYGVRGYISAYEAETGRMAWRFYTVPGDPSKPPENDAMVMAAKTWSGEWWKQGGGGPVWDAISYDPELNLLYFGVGNGVEWSYGRRSDKKGDNLFLSSIVALDADTGRYAWHFQVTPAEEWDYDAVQQLVLADLTLDGSLRYVLMQANKNGFFYILDRRNGQFISAKAIVPATWGTVDQRTGRPVSHQDVHYSQTGEAVEIMPGPDGAHSWQPMAYNPGTGLMYIPTQEIPARFIPLKEFTASPVGWNLGVGVTGTRTRSKGFLLAWDPVQQREAWRVEYRGPWNGGILTTAGNLVAQGNAAGEFCIFRADDGRRLWSMDAHSAIMGGPISYEIDGEQYIAVLSGWGGIFPLAAGKLAAQSGNLRNLSRVLVFKVGGTQSLPPVQPTTLVLNPPSEPSNRASIARGEPLFARYCSGCHGENAVGGGVTPDLRASSFLANDFWYEIVLNGAMKDAGMAPFSKALNRGDVTAIRDYIIHRSNEDRRESTASVH